LRQSDEIPEYVNSKGFKMFKGKIPYQLRPAEGGRKNFNGGALMQYH
jgi:hypothetical protein